MTGKVIAKNTKNTIKVEVTSTKVHPKYGKRFKTKKRYLVDCADETIFTIGQTVEIQPCQPVSKRKKMKVI